MKNSVYVEAQKEFEKILMKKAPNHLVELAEHIHQDSINYHKKFGVFPDMDLSSNLTKAEQVAVLLRDFSKKGTNSSAIASMLSKAFSLVMGEDIPYASCTASQPTNSYLLTTEDKWIITMPTYSVGKFLANEPVLYRRKGNRGGSGDNFDNFTVNGRENVHISTYQSQVRVPTFVEVLTFLLDFSANCPEQIYTIQNDLGLVKEDTSKK